MRTLLYSIFIVLFLTGTVNSTPKVQSGIFNQGTDLIIKAKPDENIFTGFMSASVITIKYLTSYNINLSAPVSTYGLQLYQTLTNGIYTYKIYQTSSGSQNFNWIANTEYEILRTTVSGGVGNGNIEIANDAFITSNNGLWYIEHSILGDITNNTTPLYHQTVNGVPLPVIQNIDKIPLYYGISQNYPNPFNPTTKINYDLPFDSKVHIVLYDLTGREVKTLVNENRTAGYYTINFNASDLSSGIYFYRILTKSAGKDFVMTKKMMLIK